MKKCAQCPAMYVLFDCQTSRHNTIPPRLPRVPDTTSPALFPTHLVPICSFVAILTTTTWVVGSRHFACLVKTNSGNLPLMFYSPAIVFQSLTLCYMTPCRWLVYHRSLVLFDQLEEELLRVGTYYYERVCGALEAEGRGAEIVQLDRWVINVITDLKLCCDFPTETPQVVGLLPGHFEHFPVAVCILTNDRSSGFTTSKS